MMTEIIGWRPKDNTSNRTKAVKVARYYYAYFNFMNHRPTYRAVALHFGRSKEWGGWYIRLAKDLGYIRNEWTVRIPRNELNNTIKDTVER